MRLIIVAAPSGAGKSSFVERALKEISELEDIVTYTTRSMRHFEIQNFQYHFISHDEFQKKINEGFFVEWAKVHSNLYGTSYSSIEEAGRRGHVGIMDVDIQGVRTLKKAYPDAATIFILPPSIEVLRDRVIKRDGGIPVDLELRMKTAEIEISKASEFDFQITNDDFNKSFCEFKKVIEGLLAKS
jgi:guanylate kinase